MSERYYVIRPVGVEYVCDSCGVGTMECVAGSIVLASLPPQMLHRCTHCLAESYIVGKSYPEIRWERDE